MAWQREKVEKFDIIRIKATFVKLDEQGTVIDRVVRSWIFNPAQYPTPGALKQTIRSIVEAEEARLNFETMMAGEDITNQL